MSLAEQIARQHVAWASRVGGMSWWRIILEHAQRPLPVDRAPTEADAVQAVMQAWLTLYCDELLEAA